MELKEFQGLALRTESQIQGIQLNRTNLVALLKVVVAVTEILDGIKKAAFYNKTAKLEDNLLPHLNTLLTLVQSLQWNATGRGPVGAIMDTEETLGNVDPRVFHGILGIITESGELASALLKSVEDPSHVVDAVNIQEEMSDIAWYKAILHDTLGLDWNQGLINVINKLRIRYPDKYSDEAADNRNLDAERAALEVGVDVTAGGLLLPKEGISDTEFARQIHELNTTLTATAQDFLSGKHDPEPEVTEPEFAQDEDRRVFYVNIPAGTTNAELEEIFESVRNRVRYVDGPDNSERDE